MRLLLRRLDGQTRTSDGALAALKQQQQLREPGRRARFQAKHCQQIEFGVCETRLLLLQYVLDIAFDLALSSVSTSRAAYPSIGRMRSRDVSISLTGGQGR